MLRQQGQSCLNFSYPPVIMESYNPKIGKTELYYSGKKFTTATEWLYVQTVHVLRTKKSEEIEQQSKWQGENFSSFFRFLNESVFQDGVVGCIVGKVLHF